MVTKIPKEGQTDSFGLLMKVLKSIYEVFLPKLEPEYDQVFRCNLKLTGSTEAVEINSLKLKYCRTSYPFFFHKCV